MFSNVCKWSGIQCLSDVCTCKWSGMQCLSDVCKWSGIQRLSDVCKWSGIQCLSEVCRCITEHYKCILIIIITMSCWIFIYK